ncbi:PH domain-like protein [Aulographum hederae CBS 113979]|uniref:PH domain-like protein n=1 Tax=Aulographum hederae CBS 113979 TaxID=1176131 RepID=A0A6G1GYP2_9PEZI|nr:PH domain-like protein [Aulographum hederae CBS 113979]
MDDPSDAVAVIAEPVRKTPLGPNELNFSVVRRYLPDLLSIELIANYVVVYFFDMSKSQWQKYGVEGTLFICHLSPDPSGVERFSIIILNRLGLENFTATLQKEEEVDTSSGEYIIINSTDDEGVLRVFGLWVFSEPAPSSTAGVKDRVAETMVELAKRVEQSQAAVEAGYTPGMAQPEEPELEKEVEDDEEEPEAVPMDRQLSLSQIFEAQRAQDAAFSAKNHHSGAPTHTVVPAPAPAPAPVPVHQQQQQYYPQQPAPQPPSQQQPPTALPTLSPAATIIKSQTPLFTTTPETDFFRSATRNAPPSSPPQQHQQKGKEKENVQSHAPASSKPPAAPPRADPASLMHLFNKA